MYLLLVIAATGCSLIVDTNATQCSVDADCAHLGSRPLCQQGACVIGPPRCFSGNPSTDAQFANRCTTSQTFQFDNCERLDMCNGDALAAAFMTSARPEPFISPPLVSQQPRPSTKCAEVAPNRIYITGSTNLPPLIKAVQPLLYVNDPPYLAVFAPQTSCTGAASILDPDSMNLVTRSPNRQIKNIDNNYAFYYDAAGAQQLCLLDDPDGNLVDVGESDVYPASCGNETTATTADYPGPIQAITFVVPSASTQVAISAEAAHLVFGAGGNNGSVAPWSDARYYFTRSAGTGTTQLVARSIGVDPTMMWGIDRRSAANLVASMEAINPSNSENVIGLLSSDFADNSRANLRVLAFQQRGQSYGYLPDATVDTRDKANVRDGHYPIWGAIHLMAHTENGVPSPAASAFITLLAIPKLKQEVVSAIIESGFVPSCAMKVNHTSEVGPLTSFKPSFGCGCFFDREVDGKTSCTPCGGPGDCPSSAPACNYGYCEASEAQ